MKNYATKISVLAVAVLGVCAASFAQEQQGEIIHQFSVALGETLSAQEKVDAEVAEKLSEHMARLEHAAKQVNNCKDENERLTYQTEVLSAMTEINKLDRRHADVTMNTAIDGLNLTREAYKKLDSNGVSSADLKEQVKRTDVLINNMVQMVDGLQFADEETVNEVRTSIMLLGQYNDILDSEDNTTVQVDKIMRRFENTISKMKIVQRMLQMEKAALIVVTHEQLVEAAMRRLDAFNGGQGIQDVPLRKTMEIKGRQDYIRIARPSTVRKTGSKASRSMDSGWEEFKRQRAGRK